MKESYFKKFMCVVLVFLSLMLTQQGCCTPQVQQTSTETTVEHISISQSEADTFVLNKRSKKIHKTTCGTGNLIAPKNRDVYKGSMDVLCEQGYTTCGNCFGN